MRFAWTGSDWSMCQKDLGNVLDESGTDETKYRRKVASVRRVAGTIKGSG